MPGAKSKKRIAKKELAMLSEEKLAELEKYGYLGLTIEQASVLMDLSYSYMREIIEKNDAVKQRFVKGGAKLAAKAASVIVTLADQKADLKTQFQAARLIAKAKGGWCETDKVEVTGRDGAPIQSIDKTERKEIVEDLLGKLKMIKKAK